jgi:PKHD-type hydroxylase
MADLVKWCDTEIPDRMVEIIISDLMKNDNETSTGLTVGQTLNKRIRDSKIYFFSASNWIGSFLWYYINKVNKQTFMYDVEDYDANVLQYTLYEEGQFYSWHRDQDVNNFFEKDTMPTSDRDSQENLASDMVNILSERIRKLSFSLQLNADFGGGNLEFEDNDGRIHSMDTVPGRLHIFDSRTKHRIQPVTSGTRKSLVGWIVGPRWK